MIAYARADNVANVLFFSMYSIHGDDWEVDRNPAVLEALRDELT